MSLALGTLILFLLFAPGIAFRSSFNFGPLTKKYSKTSALDGFIWAIIPGAIIQLLGACYINTYHPYGYAIDYESFGKILLATNDAHAEFKKLGNYAGIILAYNLLLIIASAVIGCFFRLIIRTFQFDYISKAFRFNNEWYYTLTGESTLFKDDFYAPPGPIQLVILIIVQLCSISCILFKNGYIKIRNIKPWIKNYFYKGNEEYKRKILLRPIDSCVIESLVKVVDENYIYFGIVDSFYLNKDGTLDTILITGPKRWPIGEMSKKFELPGEVLALKYAEIVNINISVFNPPENAIKNDAIKDDNEIPEVHNTMTNLEVINELNYIHYHV